MSGQPLASDRDGEAGRTRLIRFTTREGSWMSLDVSPDGRTVVFDLLGDLYLLPIAGGRAKPLTSGRAWDQQPRFSPDGRHIAYVSDQSGIGNLWTIDRQGRAARQVSRIPREVAYTPISSPTWTPDGHRIVVSQRRGTIGDVSIYGAVETSFRWLLAAYEVETGRMAWVSDTSAARAHAALGPVVAPGGRFLYAAVEPAGWSSQVRAWRIERVDLTLGTSTPELPPWQGRLGMRPAISPTGRLLAYITSDGAGLGLRLRDLETLEERWLVREGEGIHWGSWANRGQDAGTRDLAPGYAFTPDGQAIIIAFGGHIHRVDVRSGRRVRIPLIVEVNRSLAPMTVHQFALPDTVRRSRAVQQPALSPDGRRVAFSALGRVWVMDLPAGDEPAGQPWRLTADSIGEFYPSWSPDGQWVAYSTWRDGRGGTLRRAWVTDRARPPEELSRDTALYFHTAVAHDGQRVFATRAELPVSRLITNGSPDRPVVRLGTVSLIGRSIQVGTQVLPQPTTVSPWPLEQLYLTADSTRVHVGLASVNIGGDDRRDALAVADSFNAYQGADVSGVMSPDGRRALIRYYSTLFEVRLPLSSQRLRDSFDLKQAQDRVFGSPAGAARRWGRAIDPWISWSRDGRRVLFLQGGTLFLGDSSERGWTTFTRLDLPLMVPVDAPRGSVVLRGARVITMAGEAERLARTPEILQSADVVVLGNRIAGIGRSGTVRIPRDAIVLEMAGKTILPGYVDIHDHPHPPAGSLPQQWWGWLVRLSHGVTAVRGPWAWPGTYNVDLAYQEQERVGALIAPRIFSTGVGHFGGDSPVLERSDARQVITPYARFFNTETFKEYSAQPRTARALIGAAAASAGLNATIHGPTLQAIVDGYSGVEHNLPYPLYDDVLTFIAKSGVTLTNTFGTTASADGLLATRLVELWGRPLMSRVVPPDVRAHWTEWASGEQGAFANFGRPGREYLIPLLRSAAGVTARGGRAGIGSHGNTPGMGFHYEMQYHAIGGMPPFEILRAATIDGARAIGHANDFGSLEAGKLADLQILDKNPLDDIKNTTSIRYVMKNGRLYQAADLTEIWPRHKPLDPIYLFPDSSGAAPGAH